MSGAGKQVSQCITCLGTEPSQADYEGCSAEWTLRIKELEQGIEQARDTELSISMQKAKKVLKELQSQAAAADAAASLEAVLQSKFWRPAELKVGLPAII